MRTADKELKILIRNWFADSRTNSIGFNENVLTFLEILTNECGDWFSNPKIIHSHGGAHIYITYNRIDYFVIIRRNIIRIIPTNGMSVKLSDSIKIEDILFELSSAKIKIISEKMQLLLE